MLEILKFYFYEPPRTALTTLKIVSLTPKTFFMVPEILEIFNGGSVSFFSPFSTLTLNSHL